MAYLLRKLYSNQGIFYAKVEFLWRNPCESYAQIDVDSEPTMRYSLCGGRILQMDKKRESELRSRP